MIDNPYDVVLIGQSDQEIVGNLDVNIIPTDETGWADPPDDMIPEEPEDLIEMRVDFVVIINKAINLPESFCTDVYVEYSIQGGEIIQTPVIPGKHQTPVFDFRFHHTIMNVTPQILEYLQSDSVSSFPHLNRSPSKYMDSQIKFLNPLALHLTTLDSHR